MSEKTLGMSRSEFNQSKKNEFSLARIHFQRLAKHSSSLSKRGVPAMPGVSSRQPGIASLAALGEMRGQLCTALLHIRKELRGHLLLCRRVALGLLFAFALPLQIRHVVRRPELDV